MRPLVDKVSTPSVIGNRIFVIPCGPLWAYVVSQILCVSVCGAPLPWIEILPDPVETYTSPSVIMPKLVVLGKKEWT